MTRTPPLQRAAGLTLMEVLVTLVIFSLVVTALWQALAQVARIERALDAGSVSAQAAAMRVRWARQVVESLVPLSPADAGSFRGDGRSFTGVSSDVPGWPDSAPSAFSLSLERNEASDSTELVLWIGPEGTGVARTRVSLLEWTGRAGFVQYLRDDGTWADRWPEPRPGSSASQLPAAIAISTGSSQWPLVVAAPQTSGPPLMTRATVEKL